MAGKYDTDWVGKNWKVDGLGEPGTTNPWGMTVGEGLSFSGKGEGKDDDTITSSTRGKLTKGCKHDSSNDTVKVLFDGGYYKIERSDTDLTCSPWKSGGAVWTAHDGG
jgi:hypothetical protein